MYRLAKPSFLLRDRGANDDRESDACVMSYIFEQGAASTPLFASKIGKHRLPDEQVLGKGAEMKGARFGEQSWLALSPPI